MIVLPGCLCFFGHQRDRSPVAGVVQSGGFSMRLRVKSVLLMAPASMNGNRFVLWLLVQAIDSFFRSEVPFRLVVFRSGLGTAVWPADARAWVGARFLLADRTDLESLPHAAVAPAVAAAHSFVRRVWFLERAIILSFWLLVLCRSVLCNFVR